MRLLLKLISARIIILLALGFILSSTIYAQHRSMTLTFSDEGKLLGESPPRYNPDLCKITCNKDQSLTIRVLLPVDFLEEEEKIINDKAIEINKAINDPNATLTRLLKCKLPEKYDSLTKIMVGKKMIEWKFSDISNVFPPQLPDYLKFIEALKLRNINFLNSCKEFSPFRLMLKGILLDTNCLLFTSVNNKEDNCDCIKENNKYVALEFDIPPLLVTKDITVDSFQLIKTFPMKSAAINWYNKMLEDYKDDLLNLKLLQHTVRLRIDTIKNMLLALDSLNAIVDTCLPGELIPLKEKISKTIYAYKDSLDLRFGNFNCADSCNDNILICSRALADWTLKLIWLNGDLIRLNPFNFTTSKNIVVKTKLNADSLKKKEMARKNALIQLNFWDSAIEHLRDSVMRVRGIQIDTYYEQLKKLLTLRDSVLNAIEINTVTLPKDETTENADNLKKFITVNQTNYKGWIVPYQSSDKNYAYSPDKMWLRNYYFDQVPNPLRNKLHFTYPEDENITLLLHNIPSGTNMEVTESVKPFADSADFTVITGEAVALAASLYSSLGPVAPIVKKLLKIEKQQPTNPVIFKHNGKTDTVYITKKNTNDAVNDIFKVLDKKLSLNEMILKDDKGNNIDTLKVLKNLTQNIIFTFLEQALLKIPDTLIDKEETCYLNYLKSLLVFASAPDLIDEKLKLRSDSATVYYTARHQLSDQKAPYTIGYRIKTTTKKDGQPDKVINIDTSYISIGKYRYFQLAAGLAYSPDAGFITSVDTTGGGFKISRDEDKIRLIAGVRIYPKGLYNQKNPASLFKDARWLHRLSILIATGFPKPLENFYAGAGFDVVPGFNLSAGVHLQQQNRYSISNNQIESRNITYGGHLFWSVTVDPGLLVNAITSFFK